ncbi:MAG: type II toxin-antitoxin system RelE/ParE family toxin [Anaerolineae bacterium]|nr:type II toxin-antitoxin system RelE/ParE family toxin [Anaerolineae bacterium]
MTINPPVNVELSERFQKVIKRLLKKYKHIQSDVQTLIDQLEVGSTPGDRLQQVRHLVYKVRVKNTDAAKGKSGGYRVIYYVRTSDRVILITLYSKTEQVDISAEEIEQLIHEFEQSTD